MKVGGEKLDRCWIPASTEDPCLNFVPQFLDNALPRTASFSAPSRPRGAIRFRISAPWPKGPLLLASVGSLTYALLAAHPDTFRASIIHSPCTTGASPSGCHSRQTAPHRVHQGAQHMPQMAQLVDFMRFQVYGAAPAAVRA